MPAATPGARSSRLHPRHETGRSTCRSTRPARSPSTSTATPPDQTLAVAAAGTYPFTGPALADGAYTATATFNAGLSGTGRTTTYTIDTVTPPCRAMSADRHDQQPRVHVTLTFSEPMDLGTFTASAITLTGPAASSQ